MKAGSFKLCHVNSFEFLGLTGYIWEVNASWSATGVLPSRGALPSIFVDQPRRTLAVFDQLDVQADFDAQKLSITNATPYEAHISVANEADHRATMILPSGQMRTISMRTLDA